MDDFLKAIINVVVLLLLLFSLYGLSVIVEWYCFVGLFVIFLRLFYLFVFFTNDSQEDTLTDLHGIVCTAWLSIIV